MQEEFDAKLCGDRECPYNNNKPCPAAGGCAGYETKNWKEHFVERFERRKRMNRSTYFASTDNIENVVVVDRLSIEECMKAQKALSRLALYENTGLDPEQIVEIDKLFSEQAKELAHYKKQEERLNEIFDGVLTFKEVIDELENVLSESNKPHPTRCRVLTYEEAALWDKYKDKFAEIEESQREVEQ